MALVLLTHLNILILYLDMVLFPRKLPDKMNKILSLPHTVAGVGFFLSFIAS